MSTTQPEQQPASEALTDILGKLDDIILYCSGVGAMSEGAMGRAFASIQKKAEEISAALAAGKQSDGALTLEQIDAAFEQEIRRVSTVHYNSNEICRHFYGELRKRLAAHQHSQQTAEHSEQEKP